MKNEMNKFFLNSKAHLPERTRPSSYSSLSSAEWIGQLKWGTEDSMILHDSEQSQSHWVFCEAGI